MQCKVILITIRHFHRQCNTLMLQIGTYVEDHNIHLSNTHTDSKHQMNTQVVSKMLMFSKGMIFINLIGKSRARFYVKRIQINPEFGGLQSLLFHKMEGQDRDKKIGHCTIKRRNTFPLH